MREAVCDVGGRCPLPACEFPTVIVADKIRSGSDPGHANCHKIGLDIAKNVFQVHGIDSGREGRRSEAASAAARCWPFSRRCRRA